MERAATSDLHTRGTRTRYPAGTIHTFERNRRCCGRFSTTHRRLTARTRLDPFESTRERTISAKQLFGGGADPRETWSSRLRSAGGSGCGPAAIDRQHGSRDVAATRPAQEGNQPTHAVQSDKPTRRTAACQILARRFVLADAVGCISGDSRLLWGSRALIWGVLVRLGAPRYRRERRFR